MPGVKSRPRIKRSQLQQERRYATPNSWTVRKEADIERIVATLED
jgi:hypothetical protein